MIITDEKRIDAVLTRGVTEVIGGDELKKRMLAGEKLRIKLGIDPTSPNVHLGRSIPLLKLRDFQELGHQIVLIIGDFTGVIGDTSDKDAERPMIDAVTIEDNKQQYFAQVGKLIDITQAELHYNSEWLAKLTYKEIAEQANLFSVAEFTARDNIRKRLDAGKRVSLREMLYPLMQGYDSVHIKADVEIGGSDQRFNNLAGRTMQPHFGQKPQSIILGPLVNGIDGRKMSSSWGNTINLTNEPNDMYGKVMSMNDDEIITYFTVCTRVSPDVIENIQAKLAEGENPRNIKMQLAREIVTMYHHADAAESAEQAFIETFQKGNIPDDIEVVHVPYVDNLIQSGVVKSKNEMRRLLDAGSIRNAETDEKYNEFPAEVTSSHIIKIGKRRFVKLVP